MPQGKIRARGPGRALIRLGIVVAALLAMLLPFGVAPAFAAGPNAISLASDGATAFTVRAETEPDLFATLLNEVQWLAGGRGQTNAPERGKLGPKVAMVVSVDDVPRQAYDLYPLAAGGPRALRPAKQPDGRRGTNAWFLARLSMPDTLRTAGVPLSGGPQLITAGGGGGGGTGGGTGAGEGPQFTQVGDFADVLGAWRQVLLLDGAVVLILVAGLAGISWLIRRKV
jgi:hypothetical protein